MIEMATKYKATKVMLGPLTIIVNEEIFNFTDDIESHILMDTSITFQ